MTGSPGRRGRPDGRPKGLQTLGLRLAATALALCVVLLAVNDFLGSSGAPGGGTGPVTSAVEPARRAVVTRLHQLESFCSAKAEEALAKAADARGRNGLFTALSTLRLPADAGVRFEDRFGRLLAWSGADLGTATPPPGEGTSILSHVGGRSLVVRVRAATSPTREGRAPDVAWVVCHRAFEMSFPVEHPLLRPWSLTGDVMAEFRVASASILPPTSGEATPGSQVRSRDGTPLATVHIVPLSSESWLAREDEQTERRFSFLIVVATLVVVLLGFVGAGRVRIGGISERRWFRHGVRGLAVLFAWGIVTVAGAVEGLGDGPLTDPGLYASSFGSSPASLLVNCGGLALLAGILHTTFAGSTSGRLPTWAAVGATIAVAAAAGGALKTLVRDVVENSSAVFFGSETVLPHPGSASLLLAVLCAGAAALLVIHTVVAGLGLDRRLPGAGRAALALAVTVALVPATGATLAEGPLLVASVLGVAAAVLTRLEVTAPTLRAAVLPVFLAVGLLAPVEAEYRAAVRDSVQRIANRMVSAEGDEERIAVEDALAALDSDDELAQSLRQGHLRPDLCAALWTRIGMNSRTGASAVEIRLNDGMPSKIFGAHLPPTQWLPGWSDPPDDEAPVAPANGSGPGADGEWMVGKIPLRVDGKVLGHARVLVELRRSALARLPELEILAPAREPDTRGIPEIFWSEYDSQGRLRSSERPHDEAGSPVEPWQVRKAISAGQVTRFPVTTRDGELEVLVWPHAANAPESGAEAFAFALDGPRGLLLKLTKAAILGGLIGLLGLVLTAPRWALRVRVRLGHRLTLAMVLVSAIPLLLLAWANRNLAESRVQATLDRELRESASLLEVVLREEMGSGDAEGPKVWTDDRLRALAYRLGRHAGLYAGEDGATLEATSEPVLLRTGLLPERLPGEVYRQVVLLKRPIHISHRTVGGYTFDVGYAPLRDTSYDVSGVVAVPVLHDRRARRRAVAEAVTTVLGFYLASLAAAVAAGAWLGQRLTAPLRALTRATRRVARGDLSDPVPPTGRDELGEVVDAFNGMMSDLAESRELLVQAEKEAAWRDMARQVAHEVKNPLTPMRLAAQHLLRARKDKAADFDTILTRSVDVIVRQTEALQRIVTDFRDFARLPVRRREPVDLGGLVAEVMDLYEETPGLTLDVDAAAGLSPVSADPDELRRVVINVVGNATEALMGNEGTLAVTLKEGDGLLRLEITDDGPGIAAEFLGRIFEPSFSTKTGGTGLGLAICKRAVEGLDGIITIRSVVGEGTTVTIVLPTAEKEG